MATDIELTVDRTRSDTLALKYLVQFLYLLHFKQLSDGVAKFEKFSAETKRLIETTGIPGADAALADHLSQGFLHSLSDILDNIGRKLRE